MMHFCPWTLVLILVNSADPYEILILANSVDLNGIQHHSAFYLGLQGIPKYPFSGFQYTKF